ncbi:MAG: hypothetical protein WC878_06870 [Candidatus Paceibacterota bacterium]|jgi:hypothetical protein
MSRETIYNNDMEIKELKAKDKALLVFDFISRTLYSSLFTPSKEKDG